MISDEPVDKISAFKSKNNYSFNFLRSNKPLTVYGINTRPVTYFYDTKGNLIKKHLSNIDKKNLKKMIDKIKYEKQNY